MTLATVTRAGAEQRIAWLGGSIHHIVLDGSATDGQLMAVRSSMKAGTASPVHVHDLDDETVFVLAGSGTFWAGDRRWELSSGDTAFLPRGVPHAYAFTSGEVELLTVCTPAGMEDFFRAVGWDLARPQPADWAVDMRGLAQAGEATGQHVLGPPLAPHDEMPSGLLEKASTEPAPEARRPSP
jgi:quercetin dioxygenase-like cupin family protein